MDQSSLAHTATMTNTSTALMFPTAPALRVSLMVMMIRACFKLQTKRAPPSSRRSCTALSHLLCVCQLLLAVCVLPNQLSQKVEKIHKTGSDASIVRPESTQNTRFAHPHTESVFQPIKDAQYRPSLCVISYILAKT